MKKVLQVIKDQGIKLDFDLQEDKVMILYEENKFQTVLIIDLSSFQFFEYPLLNIHATKVICDKNLTNLLLFEENSLKSTTTIYQVNLEKAITLIHKSEVEFKGITKVYWFNSNICFILIIDNLVMYDLTKKTITNTKKLDINTILDIQVDPQFKYFICCHEDSLKNICCTLLAKDNFENKLKLENSVYDFIDHESEMKLFVISKSQNQIITYFVIFEEETFQKEGEKSQVITKNNGLFDLKNIVQIKYRKQQKDILLLDSGSQLFVLDCDKDFNLIFKQKHSNVLTYGFTFPNYNLIYMSQKFELFVDTNQMPFQKRTIPFATSSLSFENLTKKKQLHGISCENSKSNNEKQNLKQEYLSNFKRFESKFSNVVKTEEDFNKFPQAEYRIISFNDQECTQDMKKLIPIMKDYEETDTVKKYLEYFEFILNSGQPVICEGDAASGKTSIIQYLAHIKQQPLLIMNLNSNTQIDDFTGKIEIQPGFQFAFKLGPFTQAVKNGYWILLDEANLASDSILRVIEDVLELGYFTLYGNNVNSHRDIVDGILTIRKHPNFRLFLTQNPAVNERFAASRNKFSKSFLSQFILLQFPTMTLDSIKQIVSKQILGRIHFLSLDQRSAVCDLIMRIYSLIKEDGQDEGLFTLRDVLQLLELLALENNHKNVIGVDILPMKFCIEQVLTQFCSDQILLQVKEEIAKFESFGYSNQAFEAQYTIYTTKITNWSQEQQSMYLSCYSFLLKFLTLCYKTKRAALIVSQQYCGKLSSVLFWLKLQNIQYYEIVELSANTTYEDLFGKYQSKNSGFEFIEGPVVKCFVKGGVLILKNLEAPESSLTECLNGILERHCQTLIANNQEHQRNVNFFVVGISSDEVELQKKFTPALKSRFLQFNINYEVTVSDLKNVFISHAKLKLNESIIEQIFNRIWSIKKNPDHLVSFSQLIRIIRPIKEFSSFYIKCFNKTLEQSIKKIEDNIDFFILLSISLEQKTLSISKFDEIPIKFKEISATNQANRFVFTESRTLISDIIATSIACKQSLILQGSAGVGKTKIISIIQQQCNYFKNTQFYYINMNQNTELNDLMGSYVSSQEVKNTFEFKKGPLLLGMEQGGIVLCDEVNLVDRSIMNFLASVIKYPKEFFDPVSNQLIKVNDKFRLFFAQNPPIYEGRNEITDSLASKSVIIVVPNYTFEEVIAITSTDNIKINDGMKIFLSEIIQYPPDGDESLLNKNGVQFTLRQFLKFKQRLIKTNFQNEQQGQMELIQLHQEILYPFSNKLILSSNIIKKENIWIFTLWNERKTKSVNCQFQAKQNLEKKESVQQEISVQNLSEEAKLVLCKIAFAYNCQENILLQGPTSYKTFLLKLFSEMISFKSKIAFDVIYITNVTELNQLIGAVESHNESSYRNYCANILNRVSGVRINNEQIIETISKLQQNPQFKENETFFTNLRANMKNQFPFVERGITLNARFGGIVYLKNINLADQSVIEGLNSLLELEPQFYVNGKKIEKLHSELFVAASMNEGSGGKLSDALQSRLTIIQIFDKHLLDDSNQLKNTLKEYLNKTANIQDSKEAIQFTEQVIQEVRNQSKANYDNINLRTFYLWANTLKPKLKEIDLPNISNLYLGSQFLILDPIQKHVSSFKQKTIIEKFRKAQEQIEDIISSRSQNNNRIILNPITKQIIQRILFALQVQSIPCLIGPPGVGKSAIAREIARVLKKQFCRVCCSDNLSVEDLFGSYAPSCSSNEERCFIFKEGYLAKALRDKSVILFDEINLASPEVLSTLQQLFNYDEQYLTVKDFIIDKTGNLFLCCMNPPDYQGRNELPFCISNLITRFYVQQFSIDETIDIFEKSYHNEISKIVRQGIDFSLIIKLHRELANSQKDQSQLQYDFNIRFLQNLLSLFNENFFRWRETLSKQYQEEIIIVCLEIIYKEHFTDKTKQNNILNLILKKYKIEPIQWQQRQLYLSTFYTHVQLSRQSNKVFHPYLNIEKINRLSPQQPQNTFIITHMTSEIFEKLFIAIQSKRIILCQGDVATGKSTTILKFASLLNQRAIFLPIYNELETDDLLGNFSIINQNDEDMNEWLSTFVKQKYQKAQSVMKYINGVLKICMEHGYWLIMDNVNLAKAEILERLNSLGEDEPELYINEFGDEKGRIIPHENFRLICIQNPFKRTEDQNIQPLSHAFYNRCLKINFSLDVKNNLPDFLEMLSRKNDTQKFFSENNVYFAQKLLDQVQFISEKDQDQKNFRVIKRIFRMQEETCFQCPADMIGINYGDSYNKYKNDQGFPIIDLTNVINYDSLLNNLITNTLSLDVEKIVSQDFQVETLKQLLKMQIDQKYFKKYQYFIETICGNFKINKSAGQKNPFNWQLCGIFTFNSSGFTFSITPIEVEFQILNKNLKMFCMKIQFKFQLYQLRAQIELQNDQQFQLSFNENNIENVKVEEMIPFLPAELKEIVSGILKESEMTGNLLMKKDFELNLSFKKISYSLADFGLDLVKLRNIDISAILRKSNSSFAINSIISIYDVELLKISNFSKSKGKVEILTAQIIQLLGKIHKSVQFFLETLKLEQSNSEQSNSEESILDLKEKKIQLILKAQNLFFIGSLFSIQLDKLQIEISIQKPLNCTILCSLIICKKSLCQLQCQYDSKSNENLKFSLVMNKKGNNLKDSIIALFGDMFMENSLISSANSIKIDTILNGDLVIDFEEIKFNYKLQFNWPLKIFGVKLFEMQTMSLDFTKKSQQYNLDIGFELELLTMQMEIKLELDYNPNKQNKKDFMRMNISKLKQSAKLQDIIQSYSSEISKIMQEQQQYAELMIELVEEKKNQFLEWKKNDFNFQIMMDFKNKEWQILSFLSLSKCKLDISGSLKSFNIKIYGQIKIFSLTLPQFILELNKSKNPPIAIELDSSTQFQSFDPLQMGLDLLGNKDFSSQFKESAIFPKMNGIELFIYDLKTKEFNAIFNTKSETKLEFFKILTLKQVKLTINYTKERFDIKLKSDMQISNLNLNLVLDFSSFQKEIKNQSTNTLCFKLKETIEKFSLNQFIEEFFQIKGPKYIGELIFEKINFTLFVQKQNNKWGYQLQFQLLNGNWAICDNTIKFTKLGGEILFDSEKSWTQCKLAGLVEINKEEIGSFEKDFSKQEGSQRKIKITPNEKFKLENLIQILGNSTTSNKISFPFEINDTKINIMLEPNAVILKAEIKFNNYKPLKHIEFYNTVLRLKQSIDDEKRFQPECTLKFDAKIFDHFEMIGSYVYPNNKVIIQGKSNLGFIEILEIMKKYENFSFPSIQQLNQSRFMINLDISAAFDVQDKFNLNEFIIKGSCESLISKQQLENEMIIFLSIFFDWNIVQKKIEVNGFILFCQDFRFKWKYSTEDSKLSFTPDEQSSQTFNQVANSINSNSLEQQIFPFFNEQFKFENFDVEWPQRQINLKIQYPKFATIQVSINQQQAQGFLFIQLIKGMQFTNLCSCFSILDNIVENPSGQMMICLQGLNQELSLNTSPIEAEKLINEYQKSFDINNLVGTFVASSIKFKLRGEWWPQLYINPEMEINFNLSMSQKKIKSSVFQGQVNEEIASRFIIEGEWQNNSIKKISLIAFYSFEKFKMKMQGALEIGKQGISGELCFTYSEAFEIKDLTITGIIMVNTGPLNVTGKAALQYRSFKGELILSFVGFVPRGAGISLSNLSLQDVLEYFSFQKLIPSQILSYLPKINYLALSIGDLQEKQMRELFSPICNNNNLNCNCENCITFKDPPPINPFQKIVLKLNTSIECNGFYLNFNLFFFMNQFTLQCLINGDFKFSYKDELKLTCTLIKKQLDISLKGDISIFGSSVQITGNFGKSEISINFDINLQNFTFTASLRSAIIGDFDFCLLLSYQLKDNLDIAKRGWDKIIFIKYFKISINLTQNEASGILKLQAELLYFGDINFETSVSFTYDSIMNAFYENLQGLANYLNFFLKDANEYFCDKNQIQSIINQNCNKIKKQCKTNFGPTSVKCKPEIEKKIKEINTANKKKNDESDQSRTKTPPKKKNDPKPPQTPQQKQSMKQGPSDETYGFKCYNPSAGTQNQTADLKNQKIDPNMQLMQELEKKFIKSCNSSKSDEGKPVQNDKKPNDDQKKEIQNVKPVEGNATNKNDNQQNKENNQKGNSITPIQTSDSQPKQIPPPNIIQPAPPALGPVTTKPNVNSQKINLDPAQNGDQNENIQNKETKEIKASIPKDLNSQQQVKKQEQQTPQISENKTQIQLISNSPPQPQPKAEPKITNKVQNQQPSTSQPQKLNAQPQQNSSNKPQQQNTLPQSVIPSQPPVQQFNRPYNFPNFRINSDIINNPLIPKIQNTNSSRNRDQEFFIPFASINYPRRRRSNVLTNRRNDQVQQQDKRAQNCNQQRLAQQKYDLKSNYSILNQQIIKQFTDQFLSNQNTIIERLKVRVIILNKKQFKLNQKELNIICSLLFGLSILKMKFEVIFSGSFEPLLLKQADENLTLYVLDRILHALTLKQNQGFCTPSELTDEDIVLIYNFDKEILDLSDECVNSLKQCGHEQVYFICSEEIVIVYLDNERFRMPNNLCTLFSQHAKRVLNQKQQAVLNDQFISQIDLEQIMNINAAQLRKSKGIASQLKVSKFTKYSLSSKGTIIDIKGIIKFFCSNGTCKDIMKRKDKGGKFFYVFQIMLDLMNLDNDIIIRLVLPFLLFLIEACKELKIVCNLIICQESRFIKQNFQHNWTEAEIRDLLKHVQASTKYNHCSSALDIGIEQLRKFNQYQKFLIFINHGVFNYPSQQIQKLISQQSIKIINLDFEETTIFNFSLQNIHHYIVTSIDDFSQILEQIISHDIQKINQIQQNEFQFIYNEEYYVTPIELTQLNTQQMLQKQQYINGFFNYYENENSKENENDEKQEEKEIEGDEIEKQLVGYKVDTDTIFELMLKDNNELLKKVISQEIPIQLYLKVRLYQEKFSDKLKQLKELCLSQQSSEQQSNEQE